VPGNHPSTGEAPIGPERGIGARVRRRHVTPRPLTPTLVAMTAVFTAAILLVPAATPAQDRTFEKSPYVADCQGQESSLRMARKATRAIKLI
jgi:hypothetical protein